MVTGATTPIGRALVQALLADAEVRHVLALGLEPRAIFDDGDGDGGGDGDARLVYRQVDLSHPRHVREVLFGPARDLAVDAVVHAAQHRRASDDGARVHALNVECTRELLHLTDRHPTIRRFVHRSWAEVYCVRADRPTLLDEEQPLEMSPAAPQWVRDRVEADLCVSARSGLSRTRVLVLRFAECLAPECGSQLHDWLRSPVCFRPMGFDPMINVISVEDAVRALRLALRDEAPGGIFNIPGRDTLPLSALVARWGRVCVPVPAPLMSPIYRLRRRLSGADFRYDLSQWRLHFNGLLSGERARRELQYVPGRGIDWPIR